MLRQLLPIAYNILGSVFPLVVTVCTIPLYLSAIGPERFALISLLWLILGYSGFFDLGLSRATTNEIAKVSDQEDHAVSTALLTAVQVNFGLGVLGGGLVYLLFLAFGPFLVTISETGSEFLSSGLLIALCVPSITVSASLMGALDARGHFLSSNLIQSMGFAALQVGPLVAVSALGGGIYTVVLTACFVRYIIVFIGIVATLKLLRVRRYIFPDMNLTRRLMKYGGWVSITNIASPLLVTIDQFVITTVLGARALAPYGIASTIAARLLLFPIAISRAMFPRLSRSDAADREGTVQTMLVIILGCMTLVNIGASTLSFPLLDLWLGAELGPDVAQLLQPLLAGIMINSLAFVPYTYLQASGRPDLVAKFHVAEIFPFLALIWIGVTWWGISSVPYIWSLRVLVDCILLYIASGLPKKIWFPLWPYFIAVLGIAILNQVFRDNTVVLLFTAAGLAAIVMGYTFALLRNSDSLTRWRNG